MRKNFVFVLAIVLAVFTFGFVSGWHTHWLPTEDDTYDIGSSTVQVRDIYIDGKAYIDLLKATSADSINYATCTDDDDVTYILTLTDYPTLAAGLKIYFIASTPNTTGACNVSYNSTVDAIKWKNDANPAADHIEADMVVDLTFDGTNWQMQQYDANP